jgi:KaiC/GvpD/RAD55 family RecA-like ATPase
MVDGIVELRLTDDIVEDTLIKQLRVRKMSGVLAISEWESYEYTAGTGIVTFDPVAQMEAADGTADDDDSGTDQQDDDASGGDGSG